MADDQAGSAEREPRADAPPSPGRREALLNSLVAVGVLPGAALFAGYAARYLVPRSHRREAEVLVGSVGDFSVGSIRNLELFGQRIVLIRRPEGFVAFGTRCSHLGCFAHWDGQLELEGEQQPGGFYCPCHGAKFHPDGRVHSGPPPEGLPPFTVAVREELVFVTVPVYEDPLGEA